uniref:DUF834 domain-containing protein n=1 Tax=Oryza punctata TaxID=4537 RepID=A0A0E0JUU1_ORYPU
MWGPPDVDALATGVGKDGENEGEGICEVAEDRDAISAVDSVHRRLYPIRRQTTETKVGRSTCVTGMWGHGSDTAQYRGGLSSVPMVSVEERREREMEIF